MFEHHRKPLISRKKFIFIIGSYTNYILTLRKMIRLINSADLTGEDIENNGDN